MIVGRIRLLLIPQSVTLADRFKQRCHNNDTLQKLKWRIAPHQLLEFYVVNGVSAPER